MAEGICLGCLDCDELLCRGGMTVPSQNHQHTGAHALPFLGLLTVVVHELAKKHEHGLLM